MCKIINISNLNIYSIPLLHYLPEIEACYKKYLKYLQDDFSSYSKCSDIITNLPYFWIVLDFQNNFMGFAYLDNFIGNNHKIYSAELTICFNKKAWGSFIRYSAKFFFKYCFDKLKLEKIKAQIYPDNFRVKQILKDCGFIYETTLKNETLRFNKRQDIEVYSLYRDYYYNER